MDPRFESHYRSAKDLLELLATPNGLLASSIAADNYKRIWARDAVVCGLAGLLEEQENVIEALKDSLLLLAKHQHELGMIPSNVDPEDGSVSYGSLVGRVDTNTWFIIGCCLYYKKREDHDFWEQVEPKIQLTQKYLRSITMNDGDWIYTPLSGNWADEYPVHGFTLYDNGLRVWSEKLYADISGQANPDLGRQLAKILINFWPVDRSEAGPIYQSSSYSEAAISKPLHFGSFILPGAYDSRFDAAANAVALCLLELDQDRKDRLNSFTTALEKDLGTLLIPAFWPPIEPASPDWRLLQHNYSYDFKNHPGSFHNGGIWPVWMGLFCLGLHLNGLQKLSSKIVQAYGCTIDKDKPFTEFYQARTLLAGGKTQMGYSASGVIFMKHAMGSDTNEIRAVLGL